MLHKAELILNTNFFLLDLYTLSLTEFSLTGRRSCKTRRVRGLAIVFVTNTTVLASISNVEQTVLLQICTVFQLIELFH